MWMLCIWPVDWFFLFLERAIPTEHKSEDDFILWRKEISGYKFQANPAAQQIMK